ncbi:hypothetical protein MBLNU230_g3215t1 [Neophaeotheca triangularis]
MRSLIVATALCLCGNSLAHPPGSPKDKPQHPPRLGHKQPSKPHHGYGRGHGWDLEDFTSLVAFGDSYTDDSRLSYFIENDGEAPPVGYENPASYSASSGGRIWVQYVGQYSGANTYNYAVSGAVCSNEITPRPLSAINAPFPSVADYEVPAFIADDAYITPNGSKFLQTSPASTVYSLFIGTNDLGNGAFLTDSQLPGTNLTTYTSCVYEQLSRLYDQGGRYFVLQNLAPLQLLPQYSLPEMGGLEQSQYWPNKPENITAVHYRMLEQVATVNEIFAYRTPFEVEIARKFPGAKVAVMDVYGLLTDIYYNPADYLNGTAPLNVTGYVNHCDVSTRSGCVERPDPDSYLWYDELHPSEQTQRVIGREFVEVVKGGSRWATYWG